MITATFHVKKLYKVTVWIVMNPTARFHFHVFFFFFLFFFLCVNSNLTWVHCAGDKNHYLRTKKYLKWVPQYYLHI